MSSFDDLADNLLHEETDSGDVAFLPGGFRPVKKKYKIKKPDTKVKKVTDKELEEAIEAELESAQKDLLDAIEKKFKSEAIYIIDSHADSYKTYFAQKGRVYTTDSSVMIKYENKAQDIRSLRDAIRRSYKDIGSAEMLTDALENDEQLSKYAIFRRFDYLYGVNMMSRCDGLHIRFESYLDMNSLMHERIMIYDTDMAEKVGEDSRFDVSGHGVISPRGGFKTSDFKLIRNIIKDNEIDDEQETAEENRRS